MKRSITWLAWLVVLPTLLIAILHDQTLSVTEAQGQQISSRTLAQINALQAEKNERSPAERKTALLCFWRSNEIRATLCSIPCPR
jgi:hypothetical protein